MIASSHKNTFVSLKREGEPFLEGIASLEYRTWTWTLFLF